MDEPSGSMEGDLTASLSISMSGESTSADTSPHGNNGDRKRIAKVHKKNTRGETPLHVASRRGDDALCMQLLRDGADVNTPDYAGWTALHEATSHGKFDTAQLLLRNGANVNQSSLEERTTPLHDAAHANDKRIVWLLLKFGADRNCRNSFGERPQDLCDKDSATWILLNSTTIPEQCFPETPSYSPSRRGGGEESHTEQGMIASEPSGSSQFQIPLSQPISIQVGSPEIASWETVPLTAVTSPMIAGNEPEIVVKERTEEKEQTGEHSPQGVMSVDSQQTEAAMEESGLDASHGDAPTSPMRQHEEEEEERIAISTFPMDEDGDLDENRLQIEEDEMEELEKKDGAPSPLTRRSAVWKQGRDTPRTDSSDAYDFIDEERCRSEERDSTRKGRGRGGTRASGRAIRNTSTPIAGTCIRDSAEKKRGRGRKRGRLAISLGSRGGSSASSPHLRTEERDDVYEFRSSPESEIIPPDMPLIRESSAPPSSKRIRLTDHEDLICGLYEERTGSSAGNSNGDVEIEDIVDDQEDPKHEAIKEKSRAKVPILRISLKTPSEDDPMDDSHSIAGSVAPSIGRGRSSSSRGGRTPGGKRSKENVDVDDMSRMTRSRVRQSGRTVEEPDIWAKKKSRRTNQAPAETPDNSGTPEPESRDDMEGRASTSSEYNLEDIVSAEPNSGIKIMLYNSHKGFLSLRKQIEARWVEDLEADQEKTQSLPKNHEKYLMNTRNYTLDGDIEDNKPTTDEPPSILPEKVQMLWRNQETERYRLRGEQATENARIRMLVERAYIRLERREKGETQKMTAVRMIKESEIYNSLFLLEAPPNPKPMDRNVFYHKMNEITEEVYREQKVRAECLRCRQKSKLEWEARIAGAKLDEVALNNVVPLVIVKKIEYSL